VRIVNQQSSNRGHSHNQIINHVTVNNTRRGSGSGKSEAQGAAAALAVALLTAVWLFVKNALVIYFLLQFGALAAALCCAIAIGFVLWKEADETLLNPALLGLMVSLGTLAFAWYCQFAMPADLVQWSQQAPNPIQFWTELSEYGKDMAARNLIVGGLLITDTLLILLLGLQISACVILEGDGHDSLVLRLLHPFRASRGGVFSALCLVFAIGVNFW
jgi:hypothetical protein